MKQKINIFSNNKINYFLNQLCSEYELQFRDIKEIDYSKNKNISNIVFINNESELKFINFDKLDEYYLIIAHKKNNILNQFRKKNKIIKTPISINLLKKAIENFKENLKIKYHDIYITNERLINIKNGAYCYLTNIELDILIHLVKEKETNKNLIKQKILNIKINIETNSLESHLTRIRKKIKQIGSSIKIRSSSNKLLILN